MARSLYKVPFVHKSTLLEYLTSKEKTKEAPGKIKIVHDSVILNQNLFWTRASRITESLIGRKIGIYNGYLFQVITVASDFIGYRLGQFSLSRKTPKHKGKQSQKKKIIKKDK